MTDALHTPKRQNVADSADVLGKLMQQFPSLFTLQPHSPNETEKAASASTPQTNLDFYDAVRAAAAAFHFDCFTVVA